MSEPTPLDFRFSIGEEIDIALEKQAFFQRDVIELTPRGITPTVITNYITKIDNTIAAPDDDAALEAQKTATTALNLIRTDIRDRISEIWGIAGITFKNDKDKLVGFGITEISRLDDGALLLNIDKTAAKAEEHFEAMENYGLTQEMIDGLIGLQPNFRAAKLVQDAAIEARPQATNNRHIIANILYHDMVDNCEIAKLYYKTRDPLKYDDYVIYDSDGQQVRNGQLAPQEKDKRDFDAVNAGSLFKGYSIENTTMEMGFVQNENDPLGVQKAIILPYTHQTDITAASMGYDNTNGHIIFVIRNAGTNAGRYRVIKL
ncbi:MAG: hypothetical protein NTX03_14025 [Bacteroidetes bacterium]|nr:hypothetical protein [Bacteroidota bacterium]